MGKNKSKISKLAFKRYKESLGDSLVLSFTFFLLAGASLALGFLGVDFALIGVLLILLPALLSMQLMILRPAKEGGLSTRQSFRGFRLYYSFYFGVYRFWLTLLKSLICLILFVLISSVAFYYVFSAVSSDFTKEALDFAELSQQSDTNINALYECLNDSPSLLNYISIVFLVSFFFASFEFAHEIGKNTFNTYVRSFLGASPSRAANAVFSDFFRTQRRSFYKEYYQANWPATILFSLGYGLGVFLGYWAFKSITYALALGFIGAMLFLSPFLPYFFYAMDEIARRREKALLAYSLDGAEKAMEQNANLETFAEEDRQRLQKYIDDIKKRLSEGDDQKDEDKKDDNPSDDS
jgi:hypothetical protein